MPTLEYTLFNIWWRGKDSNLRRLSRQIYSLFPLTAWVPLRKGRQILPLPVTSVNEDAPRETISSPGRAERPGSPGRPVHLVPPQRFERWTFSLQVSCSTTELRRRTPIGTCSLIPAMTDSR